MRTVHQVVMFVCLSSLVYVNSAIAQPARTFETEVQLTVPAHFGFQGRPKREMSCELILPPTFDVIRNTELCGLTVTHQNLERMERVRFEVAAIHNGVRVTWAVRNGEATPAVGRVATLRVSLSGIAARVPGLQIGC